MKTKLNIKLIKNTLENNNGNLINSANALNIKYQTLYYWVRKYNIIYNSEKPELDPEIVNNLYQKLGSASAVAKELNCTKSGVLIVLHRNNFIVNKQIHYTANNDFFKQETEESLYWAGFIAADGCVRQRTKTGDSFVLQIGLASKDKNQLILFKEHIDFNGIIHDYTVKNNSQGSKKKYIEKSELVITSKEIFNDLQKFNIVPRKSLVYEFPKWLIGHPLVNHFMRGYFDGDGSVWIQNNISKVNQVIFNLLGTVKFLEIYRAILEGECNLEHRDTPIRIKKKIGVLEYGGNALMIKISNFLYKDATIYLQRKKDKFEKAHEWAVYNKS